MDINSANIEEIVRQVLAGMTDSVPSSAGTAAKASGEIPKTAHVAMLVGRTRTNLSATRST